MADDRLAELSEGWYLWVPGRTSTEPPVAYGPFDLQTAVGWGLQYAALRPHGGVLLLSPRAEVTREGVTWFALVDAVAR